MSQLKQRFYILCLSLLVLIIALAGLLGVLDSLPRDSSNTASPGEDRPEVSQPPGGGDNPPVTDLPSSDSGIEPDSSQPGGEEKLTVQLTPEFILSLPESFNLDISRATDTGLSLESTTTLHFPILKVAGAENTEYLKCMTSSYFDGIGWIQEELEGYIQYNGELLIPPGIEAERVVTDNITVSALVDIVNGGAPIPVSLYPVSVNSSVPLLYFPDGTTFLAEEEFPEEYIFETIHFIFERRTLANADLELIEEYLQLPENITPRTYELAENITGGIESPFLMAKALEDYLKTNYTYDFDFTPAPDGYEPNDWFLFEERTGVCTNFNSAFVILCRAAGIPARLAGGFHITPQEDEQTIYTDQAHAWAEVKFKELGWFTFDATGRPAALTPTITEVTSAGPVTQKGHEFTVSGTVLTDKGVPVEGTLVEIYFNETKATSGAKLIGKGITDEGRFEIHALIPGETEVGKYHVLAHSLESARYMESWSDPVIKVVTGTVIDFELPSRIKTDEPLTLAGSISGEFGEPLAGQKIKIYLNDAQVASLSTDSAGGFTWKKEFTGPGAYTLKVSFSGTEYFLASSREAEFMVLSPVIIELKSGGLISAGSVIINETASFSGRLSEEKSGNPVAGRSLSVFIDGVPQVNSPVTGNDGKFSFTYTFEDAGDHHVETKFEGDDYYFEASAAIDIKVAQTAASSPWIIIIVVLALIAAGAGGWFLYRRLKNKPSPPAKGAVKAMPEAQAIDATPWQTSGSGLRLSIELPHITAPFPDVWGAGDKLSIAVRLEDETGAGIAAPVEVSINNEVVTNPSTSKEGQAEISHVFTDKGIYEITAKYKDGANHTIASTGRPVRIVDYREEIVDLFDKLVDGFRSTGIEIPEDATPREIQDIVTKAKTDIPEKALDIAVTFFEEADYSLHAIKRLHYEYMYLAQKEIKEHGVKHQAAL